MRPMARSSGVATVAAITSALAPGSDAETETVGKSTCGSGDTGKSPKHTRPARATPSVRSVVATGRLTKGSVMFTRSVRLRARAARLARGREVGLAPAQALRQPVEVQVDHRC